MKCPELIHCIGKELSHIHRTKTDVFCGLLQHGWNIAFEKFIYDVTILRTMEFIILLFHKRDLFDSARFHLDSDLEF